MPSGNMKRREAWQDEGQAVSSVVTSLCAITVAMSSRAGN